MAITAEIDLTLESDFASEYDKSLLPDRIRRREQNNFFAKPMVILSDIMLQTRFNPFFQSREQDILEDTINCYYMFFGTSIQFLKRLGEFDPYACYYFGAGIFCDSCGADLNVLNRAEYLCNECERWNGDYMKIN